MSNFEEISDRACSMQPAELAAAAACAGLLPRTNVTTVVLLIFAGSNPAKRKVKSSAALTLLKVKVVGRNGTLQVQDTGSHC